MTLQLTSPAFTHLGPIPKRYTCDGENLSPPLAWAGLPAGTQSLALIVDDPDAPDPAAPRRIWVHWVLYNISPTVGSLPEGVLRHNLPAGAREGKNDGGEIGYDGPCPPIGQHRYFHKLYALNIILPDLHAPTKAKLEAAMRGHILTQAELVGVYRRA